MDSDSFAIASPRAPLWKFAEENPTGSQAQPQAKTTIVQGQPATSTPLKPSGSQTTGSSLATGPSSSSATGSGSSSATPAISSSTALATGRCSPICWLDSCHQLSS